MLKCKYCGNEYRQSVAQCPTCGGRKFDDSLMTVQYGAIGYDMMSQPCVVHIVSGTSGDTARFPTGTTGKIEWSKIQPGSYYESALFDAMKSGSITSEQVDFGK